MTVLSAQTIAKIRPISPLCKRTVCNGATYGLGAAGYDVRIAETLWLWPYWGRLASTIEHFNMPDYICAEVKDKSTWARKFVLVQNTFIDPGFRGKSLTLELTRLLPWPIRIRKGTPIAQIVFHHLDKPTDRPYQGKYQDAPTGPTRAIKEE